MQSDDESSDDGSDMTRPMTRSMSLDDLRRAEGAGPTSGNVINDVRHRSQSVQPGGATLSAPIEDGNDSPLSQEEVDGLGERANNLAQYPAEFKPRPFKRASGASKLAGGEDPTAASLERQSDADGTPPTFPTMVSPRTKRIAARVAAILVGAAGTYDLTSIAFNRTWNPAKWGAVGLEQCNERGRKQETCRNQRRLILHTLSSRANVESRVTVYAGWETERGDGDHA